MGLATVIIKAGQIPNSATISGPPINVLGLQIRWHRGWT